MKKFEISYKGTYFAETEDEAIEMIEFDLHELLREYNYSTGEMPFAIKEMELTEEEKEEYNN